MEHILDHEERALSRMLQQFRGKPRFEGLIAAHASRMQSCEDVLWSVLVCDDLDTATGAQLDDLGALVGQIRGQLPDAQYRVFIRARVLVNMSSGSPEELIAILSVLMGSMGSNAFLLREDFPATIVVVVDEQWTGPGVYPSAVAAIVRAARAGGVRSILEWSAYPNAQTFAFAPDDQVAFAAETASIAQGATSIIVAKVGELGDWVNAAIHLDRGNAYGEVVRTYDGGDYDQGNWELLLDEPTLWGHNPGTIAELLTVGANGAESKGFGLIEEAVDTTLTADVNPADTYIEVDSSNSMPASGVVQVRTGTDTDDWDDFEYNGITDGDTGRRLALVDEVPAGRYHTTGDSVRMASVRTDLHAGRLSEAEE